MRTQLVIAFLLGAAVALLATLVFTDRSAQPTYAQSAAGGGGFFGVTANTQPGSQDIIWLIDGRTDTPRLNVYEIKSGRLNLVSARNIKYDFQLDEFPPKTQQPSVKEVYEETEKARKDARRGPGGTGGAGGGEKDDKKP